MPAVAGVVWLMSPSVRLPHCLFENSGWTRTGSLVDSALCGCCRGSCGGVHRVVDVKFSQQHLNQLFCVLACCWVSGATLCVPVFVASHPLMAACWWLLVWGVCCVRTV